MPALSSTQHTAHSTQKRFCAVGCLLSAVGCLLAASCGYTVRPSLAPHLRTVYVQPFANKIDLARLPTRDQRFPVYRHQMEVDLTNKVVGRYQFTGLLRPARQERADARLEGELVAFHRDALRSDASQAVEEWRLNLVVNLRFYDQTVGTLLWEEEQFIGDTTYFVSGPKAESESSALDRAITDLARRIVERTVEHW